jgi:phenylalanyl-tRNA synthetase alpha chain
MTSIADTLHPLERKVLPHIKKATALQDIITITKLQDIEVQRALQWLENKGLITITKNSEEIISLDSNGLLYKEQGLPEQRALRLISEKSRTTEELISQGIEGQEINIIIGSLKKKAAIDINKEGKNLILTITTAGKKLLEKKTLEEEFLSKTFPITPTDLEPQEKLAYDNLKQRKNIVKLETKKTLIASITKDGEKIIKEGITQDGGIDALTPRMLKDCSWKKKKFRPYDVSINVPKINRGKQHFVNEAFDYVKSIWLEMGFTEMKGEHVQTAFWDLDALFVPQDHPAREMQDTFYLKKPGKGKLPEKKIFTKVAGVHENGGESGSRGWQTPFNKELSSQNLLRTHTTVLSAHKLTEIKEEDLPLKFFVVGKVYRNEALDWKHLFEFHQVDGIVIDPNANLRHLKGYLKLFYAKMGFPDVRMRPGHFPYTEPSIEVDVWHPIKKEWVEMGGAGIFRPEVTKTLIGKEIPVLAWGLGLERIISPYYGITDIRELYQNDLKQLRKTKNYMR